MLYNHQRFLCNEEQCEVTEVFITSRDEKVVNATCPVCMRPLLKDGEVPPSVAVTAVERLPYRPPCQSKLHVPRGQQITEYACVLASGHNGSHQEAQGMTWAS